MDPWLRNGGKHERKTALSLGRGFLRQLGPRVQWVVGQRRRVRMRDPEVVPLVLALVAIGTLLSMPIENGISRQIETRADVDALETTRDADAFQEIGRAHV